MSFLVSPPLRASLGEALGSELRTVSPASGGDINDAFRIGLADGRRMFVKANRSAPPGLFQREAEGLAFLREGLPAAELVVPEVLAVGDDFLVLELLDHSWSGQQDEALGRGLAQLHRSGPPLFGLSSDNFIGTLAQPNGELETWAEFYGQRRLLVQANLPGARRLLGRHERRRLDRLVECLADLTGPEEKPARLHGDLWGGNFLPSSRGPALIDPAVYGGHREVDLAMMRLFGGFSEAVFAAYQEDYPLAEGWPERVELYQLYPLLVHLNLFGAGYLDSVQRIIARYT